jgi:hypothetical protein
MSHQNRRLFDKLLQRTFIREKGKSDFFFYFFFVLVVLCTRVLDFKTARSSTFFHGDDEYQL